MIESHPSDSTEQQIAEKKVLSLINKKYKLKLVNKKVVVDRTTFQLDGYSEKPFVICEVFSHIGKLKPAQKDKVSNDIIKMILFEKMKRKKFRKIFVFADEEASRSFSKGNSWRSKLKDYFDIEIVVVNIFPSLRELLLKVQTRQYR